MSKKIISSLIFLILLSIQIGYASDKNNNKPNKVHEFSDLNDFSSLNKIFEEGKGKVRFVALLSASCGYCIKGFRYMRKILDEIDDDRLLMYVVWEPMLSGDTRSLSLKMSKKAKDPRVVYQSWDKDRISGKAWTKTMLAGDNRWHSKGPAWDVYFLYGGNAEWKDNQPSLPNYWQHQGAGSSELVLNYKSLKAEIVKLLAQLD